MSLRRLLNVVYTMISDSKNDRERADWEKWLESPVSPNADPDRQPSRGTGALMAVVGGLQMPPPTRRPPTKPAGAEA